MKELLQQYSAYNLWANKTLIHSISELSDAQINHQITSSFPSLYKTLLHMLDTESVWFQRLKLAEQPVAPSTINVLSYTGITNQLLETSAIWNDWMKKATEMSVTHVFEYRNTKKEAFKQPVYQVVLHLIKPPKLPPRTISNHVTPAGDRQNSSYRFYCIFEEEVGESRNRLSLFHSNYISCKAQQITNF